MTTTALPTEPPTDESDGEFEEPENAVLRRELGLWPVGYRAADHRAESRPRQR